MTHVDHSHLGLIIIIIKTFVRFLMAHTTHWNTHVHIWRRHRTHTHTQVGLRCRSEFIFCFFPILDCPSSRTPQEQCAACSARGPSEVNRPSLVRDGHVFCYLACFFCWGSYWRKPLVNTGRTCKLHTEMPGRD